MRLIVSGFPPFAGRPVNPSALLIESLQQSPVSLPDVNVIPALLPVDYAAVETEVDQLLTRWQPDVWIAFGVGRQSTPLRIETRGQNRDHCELPDNAGVIRLDQQIAADGPACQRLSPNLKEFAHFLTSTGIDTELSEDAGTYLCNHLIYYAARRLHRDKNPCEFVFIHLAPAESGLPTEKLARALQNMARWFQNQRNLPRPDDQSVAAAASQKRTPDVIS